MLVLEMDLPSHFRTVIVPDENHLLIVDRLKAPKRVKLCWWGNGSVEGRENPGAKEGKPVGGDPDKRQTARISAEKAEAVYFRGPALASRIRVAWPTQIETKAVEGEYGPWWYKINCPLTGMQVTSKEPVRFAVTLVDLAPLADGKAPEFKREVQVAAAADGSLGEIRVSETGSAVVYSISPEGAVTRRGQKP
jgi:hypothetical protein